MARRRRRKAVPHVVIKAAWVIHDPRSDALEAEAAVREWIARAVATLPPA